jgi:hypothetical protein
VDVAREHGRAFSFVCRLANRNEAALAERRAMRVRSEFRSVEREFIGDGVDRSAWLEPGKKSKVVSDN